MKSLPTTLDTQNGWSIIDGRVSNVPADNSSITSFGSSYPHVRSMPMNTWMGPIAPYAGITTVVSYYKESSLINPGSANAWIFIDENPISINDGSFICDPQIQDWIDCPASYHNNAGVVAFADGQPQKSHPKRAIFTTTGRRCSPKKSAKSSKSSPIKSPSAKTKSP